MGIDQDKIVRKIAENIEDAFDDMDTDDIQEAIRENIDLNEIVQELYKEDDVRNKIKTIVKKIIIDEIENTDNVNDLEILLPSGVEWSDIISGILNIDTLKGSLSEDYKIQKEMEKKIKELMLEQLEDNELPGMENLIDEKLLRQRITLILQDAEFLGSYIEALDATLKKIILESSRSSNKLEQIVKENPDVKLIVQGQVDVQLQQIIRNPEFINDLRQMLANYISRMIGNSDFHKQLLSQMLTKLTETLVQRMFQQR